MTVPWVHIFFGFLLSCSVPLLLRQSSPTLTMNKLRDVVIVAACRTPIGTFGGSLKDVSTPVLAQTVMQEAIRRAGIDASLIGVCLQFFHDPCSPHILCYPLGQRNAGVLVVWSSTARADCPLPLWQCGSVLKESVWRYTEGVDCPVLPWCWGGFLKGWNAHCYLGSMVVY